MKVSRYNELVNKYTNNHRKFKLSPDGKFYTVYYDGRVSGFIFNNSKDIVIDGDTVNSSEFFK